MKTIRDPVHSNIILDDVALRLVDTPQMQRLRRIKQVGYANLLYPGANHTRFEHSLGAYHLAGRCAQVLGFNECDAQVVKCAALLHDLGHGPFSHLTEPLLADKVNSHEELSQDIILWSKIGNILSAGGVDPRDVAGAIGGRWKHSGIVSGDIDVDRMDYLARDAHYTGVKVSVDPERIVSSLAFHKNGIVVKESGLPAVESLLVTRFLMYPSVYAHHTTRAVACMMRAAIRDAVGREFFTVGDLQKMDDSDLVCKLRGAGGYAGRMMALVDERRIFKRAFELDAEGSESLGADIANEAWRQKAVAEMLSDTGFPEGDIFVDVPKKAVLRETKAGILCRNGEVKPLDEVSTLVNSLNKAQLDHWRMYVFSSAENRNAVHRAASRYFETFRK
ncbi:MAG: phosphohydrolase [Thermoplasmata archaeon HGW-Thermoplasmata-1]|nr:MAG: phosphohydrolase [Thermoplasmata archaeon HGW-Thermoplasmata-1]